MSQIFIRFLSLGACILLLSFTCDAANDTVATLNCNVRLYKIRGQVFSLQHDDPTTLRMSLMQTKILVNYGQSATYPKEDGTFEVDLPSDSYVIEATHPNYIYEPFRVDITSKGKIRARRVNYIQPALVQTVDYPLQFKPKSIHKYFLARETWRIMDILLSPMVIMMVVPLFMIWLLPKMMNSQDVQQQRESMTMPEYNVPELSEMMASMFGQRPAGGDGNQAASGSQSITTGSSAGGGGGGGGSKKSKRR